MINLKKIQNIFKMRRPPGSGTVNSQRRGSRRVFDR